MEHPVGYMEVTASITMGTQKRMWAPNKQGQRTGWETKLETRTNHRVPLKKSCTSRLHPLPDPEPRGNT